MQQGEQEAWSSAIPHFAIAARFHISAPFIDKRPHMLFGHPFAVYFVAFTLYIYFLEFAAFESFAKLI